MYQVHFLQLGGSREASKILIMTLNTPQWGSPPPWGCKNWMEGPSGTSHPPSPRRQHYTTNRIHLQMQRSSPPGDGPASSVFLSQVWARHEPGTAENHIFWSATCQGCIISSGICKVGKAHTALRSSDLLPGQRVSGLEITWRLWDLTDRLRGLSSCWVKERLVSMHKGKLGEPG